MSDIGGMQLSLVPSQGERKQEWGHATRWPETRRLKIYERFPGQRKRTPDEGAPRYFDGDRLDAGAVPDVLPI
jgi:hypothetical protein